MPLMSARILCNSNNVFLYIFLVVNVSGILPPPPSVVYATYSSKGVVPALFLFYVALWVIQ